MKLKYLPLLLLITTPTPAFAADITDSDKPILPKNNRVTLGIESNPTTGYSWYLKKYDAHLIKPISEKYMPPKNQLPGRGGVEVWKFKLTPVALSVPHVINVTLEYRRPWEMDSGLTKTFQIVTR